MINVGCAVKDIRVPDKDGTVVDVNLGYSDLSGMSYAQSSLAFACASQI